MAAKRIHLLDTAVINKIAAGEAIQRPNCALKELLENSLDAGATDICVSVQQAGLSLLQVRDNGCGIHKDDLLSASKRFTTSKMEKFEDLVSGKVVSFGFRGEALASICCAASKVSIVSKIQTSQLANKIVFNYGKPESETPKPEAGNNGTTITVEHLFESFATRKSSIIANLSEENKRIYDVVLQFGLHNSAKSGFTLMKPPSGNPDIRILRGTDKNSIIETYFGTEASEILPYFHFEDTETCCSLDGIFSQPMICSKLSSKFKSTRWFVLFVNDRLVHSIPLRKTVMNCFESNFGITADPNSCAPRFVYLSVKVPLATVDVNIHPSKSRVSWLAEDSFCAKFSSELSKFLDVHLKSRLAEIPTNAVKHPLTSTKLKSVIETVSSSQSKPVSKPSTPRACDQVRIDTGLQKISHFFRSTPVTSAVWRDVKLSSVHELRKEMYNLTSDDDFFANFSFVAAINPKFSCLQSGQILYLVCNRPIARYLFYQLGLFQFGNIGFLKISPDPIPLVDLVTDSNAIQILMDRAAMLKDYFSLDISPDGKLVALPLLLQAYRPDLKHNLRGFLTRLALNVNWTQEKACFKEILQLLADFYAFPGDDSEEENQSHVSSVELMYAAVRKCFITPRTLLTNGTIRKVVSLPELYKVFERC